jgi:hypothetical protein
MAIICPYCKKSFYPKDQPQDTPQDQAFRVMMDIQASQKEAWLLINYNTKNDYNYYIVPPNNHVHMLGHVKKGIHENYAKSRVKNTRRKNFIDLLEYIKHHNLVVTQCYVATLHADTDPAPVIDALRSIATGLQGLYFESENFFAVHLLSTISFSNMNYFHLTFKLDHLDRLPTRCVYSYENNTTKTIVFEKRNFAEKVRATCLIDKTAWFYMFNKDHNPSWIYQMELFSEYIPFSEYIRDDLAIIKQGWNGERDTTILPADGFRGARELARNKHKIIENGDLYSNG